MKGSAVIRYNSLIMFIIIEPGMQKPHVLYIISVEFTIVK